MGDGDDKVSFSSNNDIEEGSFFDGAAGTDTFVFMITIIILLSIIVIMRMHY